MKKILGILSLFLMICLVTSLVNRNFLAPDNISNLVRWTALYGIIAIGVSFVIITGGIDLSIGSVIGLTGCLLAMFLHETHTPQNERLTVRAVDAAALTLDVAAPPDFDLRRGDRLLAGGDGRPRVTLELRRVERSGDLLRATLSHPPRGVTVGDTVQPSFREARMSVPAAVSLVMLISLGIGLAHGLLITKVGLQPFVVTLCGLLLYRGLARWLTNDQIQGFGVGYLELKFLAAGKVLGVPMPMLIMLAIAIVAAVFLNLTIYGRYLLALGKNEQAARYAGINTDRMVILAYVLCSGLAGLAGILFALDINSVQPSSHGNFYELYAIAAAVLGGCSLRGGEGSIAGVVIGTAVMRALYNSINLMGIATQLEFAIIGVVILAGVVVDELVKRAVARRRARREAG